MINQILQLAYPHISENTPDLDSYYMARLVGMWGEELMEEYTEGLQQNTQNLSEHPKASRLGVKLESELSIA